MLRSVSERERTEHQLGPKMYAKLNKSGMVAATARCWLGSAFIKECVKLTSRATVHE